MLPSCLSYFYKGTVSSPRATTTLSVTQFLQASVVLNSGVFSKFWRENVSDNEKALSTKYAEKDGVGGFAPNSAYNAAPSGFVPGGDF